MAVAKKSRVKLKAVRPSGHHFETFGEWQRRMESEEAASGPNEPQRGKNFLNESEYAGDLEASTFVPQVAPAADSALAEDCPVVV